jgi:zinc transport system ATP-binding protein
MDEPTAGVDLASQDVLSQVLARLAGRGTTMLIVTHELQALRGVLTRIIELHGGQIAFDGTPEAHSRSMGVHPADHNGHHHDDERGPGSGPASGPLDSLSGGHRA